MLRGKRAVGCKGGACVRNRRPSEGNKTPRLAATNSLVCVRPSACSATSAFASCWWPPPPASNLRSKSKRRQWQCRWLLRMRPQTHWATRWPSGVPVLPRGRRGGGRINKAGASVARGAAWARAQLGPIAASGGRAMNKLLAHNDAALESLFPLGQGGGGPRRGVHAS